MKLRQRTKNLLLAGGIGAVVVGLIATGILFFMYQHLEKSEEEQIKQYEKELGELKAWAKEQERGYVVNVEVPPGTQLTAEMLEEVLLPEKTTAENILTFEDAIGKYAKVHLTPKTLVTGSVVFEEEVTPKDLRSAEYNFIILPSKLKKDEFIDIRIQFPNGNDYVLLSKKKVKDLNEDVVHVEMKESEILTMSSAIVDAYLENAIIYALAYVDPYIQEPSIVTYPLKENVLQLITSSPNIINVAESELRSRGRSILEGNLQAMSEEEKMKYSANVEEMKLENSFTGPASDETSEPLTQEEVFSSPLE
ncbi:hypothetical protein ACFSCX_06565 [Bacillus salitolerans]|uniref:SAF domain-containing protein n=1 Tax=Bacillus salitolerans TaxID=1437434 RepID=A0ABW4LP13_9BACI